MRFFAVETFAGTFLPVIILAIFLLESSASFTAAVLRSTSFVIIIVGPTHILPASQQIIPKNYRSLPYCRICAMTAKIS